MITLGIDTGGTTTDAVIFDNTHGRVLAKAKSPTTHQCLEEGIAESIGALHPSEFHIDKVVLSTTLATNAIVEDQGRPVGLIVIGDLPKGRLPETQMAQISGKVNVKGKIITPLDERGAAEAIERIAPEVESFAVSGMMSVRNASLELKVKAMIEENCALPVVCGHELSAKLGFHDRTVTCVLNAGLIPIIENFILAVKKALGAYGITAPVYMVKGDGSLAGLSFIRQKPIESILSGPAASIIGALALSQVEDGIVIDMGGTTTDAGVVREKTLALSPLGAKVGPWQTQVDSAEITTWGLGGDTRIIPGLTEDDHPHMAPTLTGRRIIPACRGGDEGITPTDLCHLSGDFVFWNVELAKAAAYTQAEICGLEMQDYLDQAEDLLFKTLEDHVLSPYRNQVRKETEPQYGYLRRVEGVTAEQEDLLQILPLIAIGAPARVWYSRYAQRTGQKVIIPPHYEVANAVGAACASVEERTEALVRPDEEKEGFVVHVGGETRCFDEKETAVLWAKAQAEQLSRKNARNQGATTLETQLSTEEVVEKQGRRERFVETKILAVTRAGIKV